jgi:AcrR family transcriptional regulator
MAKKQRVATTADMYSSSPRERLLAAADELFYGEGIHTVGIDTIIARADVAKASLYNIFGNKDGLVIEYLKRRHQQRQEWIGLALAGHRTPRDKILAVFDALHQRLSLPDSRGCAFVNAGSEGQLFGAVAATSAEYRGWIRDLFGHLATDAGVTDPETLAVQLQLLYDGAAVSRRMDGTAEAARAAKLAAATLVDAAVVAVTTGA